MLKLTSTLPDEEALMALDGDVTRFDPRSPTSVSAASIKPPDDATRRGVVREFLPRK
jgi:hypothetical protein